MRVYLPFLGEFGWYLMTWVKQFHADKCPEKVICCKRGHECLFPTALGFFYDWQDIDDSNKAGIYENFSHEAALREKIHLQYPNHCLEFISPSRSGWHDKHDYASNTFKPICAFPRDLKADVVITPRHRQVDIRRNWTQNNWQYVVDRLVQKGISVGVCGAKDSTFHLNNVKHKSYDHVDVESDVEMMNNAKLVVTQESGLQYLSFMCERPTFCIDHYHKDHGSELHRPQHVPFKEVSYVWHQPELLVQEIEFFIKSMESK